MLAICRGNVTESPSILSQTADHSDEYVVFEFQLQTIPGNPVEDLLIIYRLPIRVKRWSVKTM